MIPLDLSVGADFIGAPPLEVRDETGAEVAPALPLPRFSLQGDFALPSAVKDVNALVSVVVTEWSGSYSLGIPYEASVVETGLDLVYRAYPFPEPSEAYTGLHIRPWGEMGLGARGVGLFQAWWNDIGRLGFALRAGAGVSIGGRHQHVVVGAKYEAVLAGDGIKGILDSGAQDMKWIWTPSAGRLYLTLGVGWR